MQTAKLFNVNTVLAIIGLILLSAGLALYSLPLALVVVGGLLLAIAILGEIRRGRTK